MTHKERRRRPRRKRQAISRPGHAPGTLMADPEAPRPVIRYFGFGPDGFEEIAGVDVKQIPALRGKWPVTWVNVDGLGDAAVIEALGGIFGLHRLALEDVLSVGQRPKVDEYEKFVFVALRLPRMEHQFESEQISLFFGEGFVLSFQERAGNCFEGICERIRLKRGRVRDNRADYLAYVLLDACTDSYFPVIEELGERLERLEGLITENPQREQLAEIYALKRDLLELRRAVWPLRDAVNNLMRTAAVHVTEETRYHLRDCYDHTVRILEMVESHRESATSLLDVYLSSLSNRMNEVMKVLTIIATIFIPLGFIASLYGMNFDVGQSPWNMPELRWYWGYPFALGIMAVVALGLLYYFKRKGWLD